MTPQPKTTATYSTLLENIERFAESYLSAHTIAWIKTILIFIRGTYHIYTTIRKICRVVGISNATLTKYSFVIMFLSAIIAYIKQM